MVATNLKSETMKLMEKRSGMEEEMNVIIQRLCQPGGPGLAGNLVDSEGFPRTDIDIPTVRADRRRLAELRNDHKDITEKINQNIQLLHSAKLAPTTAPVKDSDMHPNMIPLLKSKDSHTPSVSDTALTEFTRNAAGQSVGMSSSFGNPIAIGASSAMDVDFSISRPFAMVDEISEASPAAEDGLQLGDQIVKFGNVERGENLLQRLAAEAHQKQGEAVSLVVMRQGALINLTVTPRTWSGRGLLGCHFRVL